MNPGIWHSFDLNLPPVSPGPCVLKRKEAGRPGGLIPPLFLGRQLLEARLFLMDDDGGRVVKFVELDIPKEASVWADKNPLSSKIFISASDECPISKGHGPGRGRLGSSSRCAAIVVAGCS